MLFLTTGDLFHEGTWRQWFRSAEGLIFYGDAMERACGNDVRLWEAAQSGCSVSALDAISMQHLYSVYIHAPPKYKGNWHTGAPVFCRMVDGH